MVFTPQQESMGRFAVPRCGQPGPRPKGRKALKDADKRRRSHGGGTTNPPEIFSEGFAFFRSLSAACYRSGRVDSNHRPLDPQLSGQVALCCSYACLAASWAHRIGSNPAKPGRDRGRVERRAFRRAGLLPRRAARGTLGAPAVVGLERRRANTGGHVHNVPRPLKVVGQQVRV